MSETSPTETALSGRRKQAALNDDLILEAAREVFLADPTAPIAAVAKRAGVGISALYRRFPSKEEMLRGLCADGQQVYLREVRRALEADGDPWEVYAEFLHRIVAEDTHALGTRLAGLFTPTEAMFADAGEMQRLGEKLFNRTKKAGALRPGLTFVDVSMLLEAVANVRLGDAVRSAEVRQRMVALLVDGLRAGGAKLPGRAPTWKEQEARWHPGG